MAYIPPTFPLSTKTTTYSITISDGIILGDTSGGAFTVTLPTAVGNTGRQFIVKNIGAKVLTIATTSAQTIDGTTTFALKNNKDSVNVISDGANWVVI